jgi:membrane-bound ClpP family serine protease
MDKRNLAFDRTNFILLGIGFAIVVIGFILMSGSGSTEQAFNPDIFSARRIKLAPVVCFIGFISMIYAIIHKPKDSDATAKLAAEEADGVSVQNKTAAVDKVSESSQN